jgi:hypothetical protein
LGLLVLCLFPLALDSLRLSVATGGLSVLTTNTDAPVVAETTMGADLLEALKILTELCSKVVGEGLHVLTSLPLALPVQEPLRDLELLWTLNNRYELFNLVLGELATPAREKLLSQPSVR